MPMPHLKSSSGPLGLDELGEYLEAPEVLRKVLELPLGNGLLQELGELRRVALEEVRRKLQLVT